MPNWLGAAWGNVLAVGGALAAVAAFIHSLLSIKKLNIEIENLQRDARRQESKIVIPSLDEISRYTRALQRGALILPLLACVLVGGAALLTRSSGQTVELAMRQGELERQLKEETNNKTVALAERNDLRTQLLAKDRELINYQTRTLALADQWKKHLLTVKKFTVTPPKGDEGFKKWFEEAVAIAEKSGTTPHPVTPDGASKPHPKLP